jgi:hypothetical protein
MRNSQPWVLQKKSVTDEFHHQILSLADLYTLFGEIATEPKCQEKR